MRTVILLACVLAAWSAPAQTVQLEQAFPALRFDRPVDLQHADGRLFVVEQHGVIWVFDNDPAASQATEFLDIRSRVSRAGNEEGLLGLAFAPDYTTSGDFYVYYSARSPRRSIVARYQRSATNDLEADPASESVVMTVAQPYSNHNGGQIAFGPDQFLYIGLGDGGSAGDPQGHSQNRSTLLGNILRIDVSTAPYSIPSDNPFVGNSEGFREEIWAWGLRNPWRFSFDRDTGLLYAADVGQNAWEEIDLITKGTNYGWRTMEGPACYRPPSGCNMTGLEPPLHSYGSGGSPRSVTGGFVYRSTSVPDLYGKYVYGDYVTGEIWALSLDGTAQNVLLVNSPYNIASFGEGPHGEVYVLAFNGRIYRFAPADLNLGSYFDELLLTIGVPVTPALALPGAEGGVVPYSYALTPDLPPGLTVDLSTRELTGTPTATFPTTPYTWAATDALGASVDLAFDITVSHPMDRDAEDAPVVLVRGAYPNPYSGQTDMVLDLNQAAQVQVSVLDLLGRTVLALPRQWVAAGVGQRIPIVTEGLPAGMYFFHTTVGSGTDARVQTGMMLHVR